MAVLPDKPPAGSGGGTSLERGLRVLLAVSDRGSVRVDSLVEQLGLPASTVYRYLRTLRDLGLVEETDGWYRPGEYLGTTRRVSNSTLASLAKPILRRLAAETGETALITVRAGMAALCVEQVESPSHMRMAFEIGQVLPLQAGAASRVLLAYAPQDVIERALGSPLAVYTPSTPDAEKLRRQLENIRATRLRHLAGRVHPRRVRRGRAGVPRRVGGGRPGPGRPRRSLHAQMAGAGSSATGRCGSVAECAARVGL